MKLKLGVLGAVIVASGIGGAWRLAGSAGVIDEKGRVASAVLIDGDGTMQPLRRLPFGVFYAVPRLEGALEVRCRVGGNRRLGYVTPHMHTWVRVDGCDDIRLIGAEPL